MQRIATMVLAAVAAFASVAAGASAATLTTDTRCYQETQDVVISGTGFAPDSIVTILRDDKVLGSTQTDAGGAFRNKVETPQLPRYQRERLYELTATDIATIARTTYRATRIYANFAPRSGNPSTLKVRFSINGFGLVKRRSPAYLHYVRPNGKAARTIKLGTATGTCGAIKRTKRRRLFPFNASKGVWILQFDTRRTYARATSKRRTPWVRKRVEIFARRR